MVKEGSIVYVYQTQKGADECGKILCPTCSNGKTRMEARSFFKSGGLEKVIVCSIDDPCGEWVCLKSEIHPARVSGWYNAWRHQP